jgi:hypothetical protein
MIDQREGGQGRFFYSAAYEGIRKQGAVPKELWQFPSTLGALKTIISQRQIISAPDDRVAPHPVQIKPSPR